MKNTLQEPKSNTESILRAYPLQSIYFYLTGDCNLACRHCWISPKYQKKAVSESALDFPLFCKIIDQAKPLGLNSVKLTGGEPLIHPMIRELLLFIQEETLILNLESNGIALTSDIAALIADSKNPFLSISIDGADALTHEWMRGVPGCFEKAIHGMRIAVDAGIKPQIIMTLTRRNFHQTEALIEIAEREGAGSVKLNILQPIARGKSLTEQRENLSINELIQFGSRFELEIAPNSSIPVLFSHPYAFRPLNKLFHKDNSCGTCFIHRILGVLHNGSYALCGIGQTVPEMVFGDASSDNLAALWLNHSILQKIRKGIPEQLKSPCRECVMKYICLGNCVAHNFARSHDLCAPYWYCEEASKKGLFPPTRLK